MPPKRRGGLQQRLAAAEQEELRDVASELVMYLLGQWAWGLLSATKIQVIAMKTVNDIDTVTAGTNFSTKLQFLKVLAGLGTSGKHPQNCAHDLYTHLNYAGYWNAQFRVMVPLSDASGANPALVLQVMLLPHVWFSVMFNNYYESFQSKICASREQISEFWNAMRGNSRLEGHPVTARTGYKRRCIPIRIHGDGVPVTGVGKSWGKSADIYSWNSFFATGPTIEFNFYIWAVFKAVLSTSFNRNTKNTFWKILVWSLKWLWLGLWPNKNWDGSDWVHRVDIDRAMTPLAGTDDDFLFCCVWGLLGDLEYFKTEYGLQDYNSNDPCNKCPANNVRGGMCVNEFRHGRCEWKSHLYTKLQWNTSVYNTHPIFTVPGVTILTVCADYMHCKHLGTDAYFFGSVLFVLCYYMLPGLPQQNIEVVWAKIKSSYKTAARTRYTNLRLSMFSSVANPELYMPFLKGRSIEVRDIGPPLLEAFRSFMGMPCTDVPMMQQQQILLALQNSIAMDTIIHDNAKAITFSGQVLTEFQAAGYNYLILFNALGTYYAETHAPAKKIFDVTIKAHYLAHCVVEAEFMNPRLGWCYSGEDFMFRIRRLLATCCYNSSPSASVVIFIKKYLSGMHLLHVK